jgi:hypothetical protein
LPCRAEGAEEIQNVVNDLIEFPETLTATLARPISKMELHGGPDRWKEFIDRCASRLMRLATTLRRSLSLGLGRVQQQRRIKIIERISLAPRHSLVMIEADGRQLLVSLAQGAQAAFFALGSAQLEKSNSQPRRDRSGNWHAPHCSAGIDGQTHSKRRVRMRRRS